MVEKHSHMNRITGWITLGLLLILPTLIFCRKVLPHIAGKTTTYVTVQFESIKSLQEGESVKANGMEIGSIETVEYKDGQVHVTLALKNFSLFKAGIQFVIRDQNILGGRYIELVQGTGRPTAARTFPGKLSADIESELPDLFDLFTGEGAGAGLMNMSAPDETGVLLDLFSGEGTIREKFREIRDAVTAGDKPALEALVFSEAEQPFRDEVKELFQSGNLLGRSGSAAATLLAAVAPDIAQENDRETADAMERIKESYRFFRDLKSGQGSLALFDGDSPLWRGFTNLREVLQSIQAGEGGLLGMLFSGDDGSEDLQNTMDSASGFFERLSGFGFTDTEEEGETSSFIEGFERMLTFFTGYDPYGREKSPFTKLLQLAKTLELYES